MRINDRAQRLNISWRQTKQNNNFKTDLNAEITKILTKLNVLKKIPKQLIN